MKNLISLLLLAAFVSSSPAAEVANSSLPDNAKKLVEKGINNETDLKNFLLTVPHWTWERFGVKNETVRFERDGVVTHTTFVGKWAATGPRRVIIRIAKLGPHTLTFSDDLTSFKGVSDKNVPFTGRFIK